LSDHPDLMLVAFRFDQGGLGALHNHVHVQATYVQSGRFRFTLGSEEREVTAGDSFVIPSLQTHGCICLEAGVLIDSFTPRRDDFL
jgi:quercetin dioxygenase-like cupin family protein